MRLVTIRSIFNIISDQYTEKKKENRDKNQTLEGGRAGRKSEPNVHEWFIRHKRTERVSLEAEVGERPSSKSVHLRSWIDCMNGDESSV